MFDSKGLVSAEYLLLIGALIVIILISLSFIASQHELTMAMTAARNGVMNEVYIQQVQFILKTLTMIIQKKTTTC